MSRPVTARPPAEHLAVLTRMMRQIDSDDAMRLQRQLTLKRHLHAAITILNTEDLDRAERNGGRRRKARGRPAKE